MGRREGWGGGRGGEEGGILYLLKGFEEFFVGTKYISHHVMVFLEGSQCHGNILHHIWILCKEPSSGRVVKAQCTLYLVQLQPTKCSKACVYMGVWVYVSTDVWVYVSMDVWEYGCM